MLLLRNSTKSTRRVLPYEIHVHSKHRDEQLATLVADAFALSPHQQSLRIQPLTGGLSNSLFVAYHHQQPVALIRVHPDALVSPLVSTTTTTTSTNIPRSQHPSVKKHNHHHHNCNSTTSPFIDHQTETKLLSWLSQQHDLAPQLYGSFLNGRIEEFYPHHHPLSSCRDMILYAPIIAERMAQLHTLSQDIVTISCWERTRQWLQLAQSLVQSQQQQQQQQQQPSSLSELISLLQVLQDEWKWIESIFISDPPSSSSSSSSSNLTLAQSFLAERVLTHGDLQSLNVLVHETNSDDVRLIDYEYASYSPRGLDIANTFCEYCNMNQLCAQYEQEYPTQQQQYQFLQSYLQTLCDIEKTTTTRTTTTQIHHSWQMTEDFLQELVQHIGRYTVVSHISWAIWSIVQHYQSAQRDTFDYIAYAKHRLEGHAFSKKQFFGIMC